MRAEVHGALGLGMREMPEGCGFENDGSWAGEISRGHALTIGTPIPSFTQHFSPHHGVSESTLRGPDPCSAIP